MSNRLTNIRTYIQFSQYGNVMAIVYNGNKLMAMNAIKYGYGVKQLSVLREYKEYGYLIEGTHTVLSMPV